MSKDFTVDELYECIRYREDEFNCGYDELLLLLAEYIDDERIIRKAFNNYRDNQRCLRDWFRAEKEKREIIRTFKLYRKTAMINQAQYIAVVEQNRYLQQLIKENRKWGFTDTLKTVWKQLKLNITLIKNLVVHFIGM